jgi:hypothetical protein
MMTTDSLISLSLLKRENDLATREDNKWFNNWFNSAGVWCPKAIRKIG